MVGESSSATAESSTAPTRGGKAKVKQKISTANAPSLVTTPTVAGQDTGKMPVWESTYAAMLANFDPDEAADYFASMAESARLEGEQRSLAAARALQLAEQSDTTSRNTNVGTSASHAAMPPKLELQPEQKGLVVQPGPMEAVYLEQQPTC